jgi:aerobic-type carbon monoxide dehydrogenase small subunit (CoxS/CutS family)
MSKAAVKQLKKRLGLNTENMFVDTAGTTTSTATLVQRIASPVIPQGDTVGSRAGVSIRVDSVDLRISCVVPAAATTGNVVRIIAVRNRKDGSASVADILQTTTDISSPIHNLFAEHQLELLMDQTYELGTATGSPGAFYVHRVWNPTDWHMTWTDSDTTGVNSNLVEGAISVWWYVDNVTTAPVFTSTMRVRYVDN